MPWVTATIAACVALLLTLAALTRGALRRMRRAASALNDTIPVNSAWWRARAKEQGDLLYAALGDSAAQGLGATEPDDGYVGLLARSIALRGRRSVRTVNLSVSGATVAQLIDYQLPRLAKLQPDVVTVAIGSNDIARWDAVAFARGLVTVFDALPSHAIVAELPYFYLPRNERKVAEANRIVRRLATERGLAVAPVHRATRALGPLGALLWFAGDHFHPNDAGYRVWAAAFEPLVARRVEELSVHEISAHAPAAIEPSTGASAERDSTSPPATEGGVGGRP
ncbi:SGNH/GDSL hydrolase family protein [Humibacter ginsenosidimutans]|uniref:SGNH/GDSL hydrolase family protein n=1 Tax=Humibacter ginsenosidimutans TaxID=2599293 RepID=A0A5B8M6A5_9MICO|nr:SGNH/GDSL hydrolase family protein [Humibacter ginsenosidimutans]QDZ15112.1 SGNH/GDSL hydrolase family protein [Humibacter ginsenosidimutans]